MGRGLRGQGRGERRSAPQPAFDQEDGGVQGQMPSRAWIAVRRLGRTGDYRFIRSLVYKGVDAVCAHTFGMREIVFKP